MLIKLRDVKYRLAIGLRWAVDTRHGIEMIQFDSNLNYGVMLDLKDKSHKSLKLTALTDETHDKAVCLAGLFAKAFTNLIYIHRLSDSAYWLCVVKNGEVWSGVDIPRATAGDLTDSYDTIKQVVDHAVEDFKASGIDVSTCLKCTDIAASEFPDCQIVELQQLLAEARKYRKRYMIHYLEPSKVVKQKMVLLVVILAVIIGAGYFFYHNYAASAQLRKQQAIEARQKAEQVQAEKNFFMQLQTKINKQWGYSVIQNVMAILKQVPTQSHGWKLSTATYAANKPTQLALSLTRSEYGTLDSFIYAYTPDGEDGKLATDNNVGSKTITFNNLSQQSANHYIVNKEALQQKIPKNLYSLISFMQLHNKDYTFQVDKKSGASYGVRVTGFTLSGEELWQLMQVRNAFKQFPTLIIDEVVLTVQDYDMSWQIKGEIYA